MYPISPLFDEYLRRYDREFRVKVIIDGVEYDNKVIVDFVIEDDLTLSDSFEIGTAIPSKLILRLKTPDVIPPNARVVPYLSLSLANMSWQDAHMPWDDAQWPWLGHVTEWLPLGEFYVDSREQVNEVWTFTCFDKLVLADVPYISSLTYPATMQAVFDEVCTGLGYTYDSSVVIDPSYEIEVGPAGYSKRQVLGYIAGANAASVFAGKNGVIKFKRFSAAEIPVFDMRVSDYISVKHTNPIKSYTRIVVTYNTEDGLDFDAGTGDENHTLYLENPFVTQEIVEDLQATLDGFAYLPITMQPRGFPQLEPGDVIGFDKNDSKPWIETFTTWDETDLPWTGINGYQSIIIRQVLAFRGGLKMAVEAPSKSEQQSEFKVDGTLTTQVNKLNKGTIKYDKPYFGVTHSRTEGIVVEREDHKSKLTLNSDVQEWKVDGIANLYYDALANKLKFKGDVEMEGGSISWTAVNPPSPTDVGALPDDDPKLSQLSNIGDYLGELAQGQVTDLPAKIGNLNSIGEYIGALSQGQVSGLSTRLTNVTPTGLYTGTVGTDQLIAGSALIGTALIEDLIVGSNVLMGPNAEISWSKVTSKDLDYTNITGTKPPTNADNTYTTIGSDRLTKITSTGVYTGTVTTDQLITGTAKISTALIEDLVVGGNVTMGPGATISWGNVTSKDLDYTNITGTKPASNADNTYNTIGSNRLTQIGPTGIYTGTLTTDQIVAGTAKIGSALIDSIKANQIDVTGGKITASQIDVTGLYVGTGGISLDSSATISWNTQVTGKPFIPSTASDVGALPSSSPKLTHIDSYGIYTGTLTADKIVGSDFLATNSINIGTYTTNNTQRKLGFNQSVVFETIADFLGIHNILRLNAREMRFNTSDAVRFNSGTVDFTGATVTGLNVTAKFS